MGALYHLKQKLVDFCNVIQENVSRTDTVPSSKVVYDLKADSDSQISNKLTNVTGIERVALQFPTDTTVNTGTAQIAVTFDHELQKVPSFILCAMPQTNTMFISAFGFSKTGCNIRVYNTGSAYTTSMMVAGLAVYSA